MASRDPPKKEGQGKGMQKQEALDAHVTELCTSLQEIMADGETSGQESSATETPLVGIQRCWVVYVWRVPFIGVLSETVQVVW